MIYLSMMIDLNINKVMNIKEIEEKSLTDIHKSYIKDIIDFFVKNNYNMYSKNNLKELLDNQINTRLLEKDLILDFKVDINIKDLQELRDEKIESIINDKNFEENNITIYIQYPTRELTEFKYYLT